MTHVESGINLAPADRTQLLFTDAVFGRAAVTDDTFDLTLTDGTKVSLPRRLNECTLTLPQYREMILNEKSIGPVACTTAGRTWFARFRWKRKPGPTDPVLPDGGVLQTVFLVRHVGADLDGGDVFSDRFTFEFPSVEVRVPQHLCGRPITLNEAKKIADANGEGLRCDDHRLVGKNGRTFNAVVKFDRVAGRIVWRFIDVPRSGPRKKENQG
jgi:hypothetical protein